MAALVFRLTKVGYFEKLLAPCFLMNQTPVTFEGPEFDNIGFFLQGYLKNHRVTVTKLHGPFQVGESQIQPRLLSTDRQAGAQKL